MTTTSPPRPATDAVLSAAVDVARAAAEEVAAPGSVGQHLGAEEDAERLATHRFACLDPAYNGWHWAVSLARVPRGRVASVCEVVLLPGPDALRPREWVPWSERLAPGDLGVGDLLPTEVDDDRLEPGWASVGTKEPAEDGTADDDADRLAVWELGLGRPRVLSPIGRADAVDRWYSGDHGPTAPIAEAAPAPCATCGFLVLLAGNLRRAFGVCANAYSPSDGRVVSLDHGCGAHSEVAAVPGRVEVTAPFVDEMGYDVVDVEPVGAEDDTGDEPDVDVDDVAGVDDVRGPADAILDELADESADDDESDATAALRARVLDA